MSAPCVSFKRSSALFIFALIGGGTLLAENITSCDFSYQPGNSQRAAVVGLKLTLKVPGRSDRIQLLQQVHLENTP